MPKGFTKLHLLDFGECGAAGSDRAPCSPGPLLRHLPPYCGGGDYSDREYGFCRRHASAHARDHHRNAQSRDGFRSLSRGGNILSIDCLRCGMRNVVEGTVASAGDWAAADQMLLAHNGTHHPPVAAR